MTKIELVNIVSRLADEDYEDHNCCVASDRYDNAVGVIRVYKLEDVSISRNRVYFNLILIDDGCGDWDAFPWGVKGNEDFRKMSPEEFRNRYGEQLVRFIAYKSMNFNYEGAQYLGK